MTAKQLPLSLQAPDGSYYACLTDGNGNLVVESALPTGAATSANQTTEITALQAIVNQTAAVKITDNFLNSGTGLGVDINGRALVNVGTSVLPTGAATSANQTLSYMSGTTPGTAPSSTGVVGGIYNTALPAPTNGQTLPLQLDPSGRLITYTGIFNGANQAGVGAPSDNFSQQTGLVTTTQLMGYNSPSWQRVHTDGSGNLNVNLNAINSSFIYTNISTSTTTVVKTGSGILHTININSLGTVASTVTIYDNTSASGTTIATLNSLTIGQGTYTFDVSFSTGLTIVTTGTVAPNVTVSYK